MKNVVVSDEYNELDLKPSDLLKEYIQRTQADVFQLLANPAGLKTCFCPGCGSDNARAAFKKFGLQYQECAACKTLYVSPRPDDKTLNNYYANAGARIFWRDKLSKSTDKKRKEKIIKPRFQWLIDSTQEYLPRAAQWADIHTTQYGYIEEMLRTEFFRRKTLIQPFLKKEIFQSDSRVSIFEGENWGQHFNGQIDVVSLFEVADHAADIESLFQNVHRILKAKGLCFVTAILASGFDIQTLWEKAENLYPPDRLNVFSVEGFKKLFERHHFECLEFSTPGILDVDIVAKSLPQNGGSGQYRFIEQIINGKDDQVKRAFQEFLQANLLSSYGRILLRKTK